MNFVISAGLTGLISGSYYTDRYLDATNQTLGYNYTVYPPTKKGPLKLVGTLLKDAEQAISLSYENLQILNNEKNLFCTCGTYHFKHEYDIVNTCQQLIEEFDLALWSKPAYDFPLLSDFSCVLVSLDSGNLWMFADEVGRIPLWYSFASKANDDSFVVTSDYLGAIHLGSRSLSSVPPAYTMQISINENLIKFMTKRHKDIQYPPKRAQYKNLEQDARELYQLLSNALLSELSITRRENRNAYMLRVDMDELHPSSKFLACVIEKLIREQQLPAELSVQISEPLLVDYGEKRNFPAALQAILGDQLLLCTTSYTLMEYL